MDREAVLAGIAQLDRRIASAQAQIERYEKTIGGLQPSGRDAEPARLILRQYRDLLLLHLSVRARLQKQLVRLADKVPREIE